MLILYIYVAHLTKKKYVTGDKLSNTNEIFPQPVGGACESWALQSDHHSPICGCALRWASPSSSLTTPGLKPLS